MSEVNTRTCQRQHIYDPSSNPDWLGGRCPECTREKGRTAQLRYSKTEKGGKYKLQWRQALRAQCIEKYGGRCCRCQFDDPRALQFDHVNGDGRLEISKKSREQYYRTILNDETGKYQLLCANCNWIKRYENEEWKKK